MHYKEGDPIQYFRFGRLWTGTVDAVLPDSAEYVVTPEDGDEILVHVSAVDEEPEADGWTGQGLYLGPTA